MSIDWKKDDKQYYLPKAEPEVVQMPKFKFFTIAGKGNPNNEFFGDYIKVLYQLSYGVRMSYKGDYVPKGYETYKVYPLEGVWDITEEAKKKGIKKFNKDDLVFNLMIRQPEFVTKKYFEGLVKRIKETKDLPLLEKAKFEEIKEGLSIQMMHIGSYDNEPKSFALMEKFCKEEGLKRKKRTHREIYLSDFRRVEKSKLKTVLRFEAKK